MDNYYNPLLTSEFKTEVLRELHTIFDDANNIYGNECGENLDKVKKIEDKYFTNDLRSMFKRLKENSNNFSENYLQLQEISDYYSIKFNDKIEEILKDFEKLLSIFLLTTSNECKKINKSKYSQNLTEYKKCEKKTKVEIKKILCFREKFMNDFSILLQNCLDAESSVSYTLFRETRNKKKTLIISIIGKYKKFICHLSLFSFFLNEIKIIFTILNININFLKIFFVMFENGNIPFNKKFDTLFLKHIFKHNDTDDTDDTDDIIKFLLKKFGKDVRSLDELMRIFLLKTIIKYFKNTDNIKNFISDIENINEVITHKIYNINIFLRKFKDILNDVFNIILNEKNLIRKQILYKAFLYMLMLYLLFINIPDFLDLLFPDFLNGHHKSSLEDHYSIKKQTNIILTEEQYNMFKDFFDINIIYKLIISNSDYGDILFYEKEKLNYLEKIIFEKRQEIFNSEIDYRNNNEALIELRENVSSSQNTSENQRNIDKLTLNQQNLLSKIKGLTEKLKKLEEQHEKISKIISEYIEKIDEEIDKREAKKTDNKKEYEENETKIENELNELKKIKESYTKKQELERSILSLKDSLVRAVPREQLKIRRKIRRLNKEINDILDITKDEILINALLPSQDNQDVIKDLNLLEYDDFLFYLSNNVRKKEEITSFFDLIKKYIPDLYKNLLSEYEEIGIYINDEPSLSINFSPSNQSPQQEMFPSNTQTQNKSVFDLFRRSKRILPLPLALSSDRI